VLDIHLLAGHRDAEFKCGSFIEVGVQGNTCDIPGPGIPSAQFIYDLIWLTIPTDQGYIKIGTVIQDLEKGLFRGRTSTIWELLNKIALPCSEGPNLIVQHSVNFGLGKFTDAHRVIYTLVVKQRIDVLGMEVLPESQRAHKSNEQEKPIRCFYGHGATIYKILGIKEGRPILRKLLSKSVPKGNSEI
jgi:hypothetical protein